MSIGPVSPQRLPKTAPAKAACEMHTPRKGTLMPTMNVPSIPVEAPAKAPEQITGAQNTRSITLRPSHGHRSIATVCRRPA